MALETVHIGPVPLSVAMPEDGPPRHGEVGEVGGGVHGGVHGGVIVVGDARGVTNYVLSVCEQLRDLGWVAVAPHFYHRDGEVEVPVEQGSTRMRTLTAQGLAADVDACLAHLATVGITRARTAIIGFCMGGTAAFLTAVRHRLGAAVSFYGGAVSEPYWSGAPPLLEVAGELRSPWLGLYGENDSWVSLDEIRALRAATAAAAVPTELVSYPGAQHAFHTPERPSTHDPLAARDAWARMERWLRSHAGADAEPPTAPGAEGRAAVPPLVGKPAAAPGVVD